MLGDEIHHFIDNGARCYELPFKAPQGLLHGLMGLVAPIEVGDDRAGIDQVGSHRQLRPLIRRLSVSFDRGRSRMPSRCPTRIPRVRRSSPLSISSRTTSERVFPSARARRVKASSWRLSRRIVNVLSMSLL